MLALEIAFARPFASMVPAAQSLTLELLAVATIQSSRPAPNAAAI